MKYSVEITRSITTTVEVEANDANAARDMVDNRDFALPARDEWQGHKDWTFAVYKDGGLVLDEDGFEVSDEDGDEDDSNVLHFRTG